MGGCTAFMVEKPWLVGPGFSKDESQEGWRRSRTGPLNSRVLGSAT